LLESFKSKSFVKKYILDTSKMSADEVAEEILKNNKYYYE
jgi:hypothetical protein